MPDIKTEPDPFRGESGPNPTQTRGRVWVGIPVGPDPIFGFSFG